VSDVHVPSDAGDAPRRAGVAVISVWFEKDDPRRPRARITTASEPLDLPRQSWAAAGSEEIARVVGVWLAQLVESAGRATPVRRTCDAGEYGAATPDVDR